MERLKRGPVAVLSACVVALVTGVMLMGVGATTQPAEKWAPQFPREGATKLFENDHIIVWEQIGRPAEPFVHKHIHDILMFTVEPGRVEVLGPDLERPTVSQGLTERIYSRGTTSVTYSKAGLGPHVEMATDPDNIPVSIFVEVKGTEPADCAEWSTACE